MLGCAGSLRWDEIGGAAAVVERRAAAVTGHAAAAQAAVQASTQLVRARGGADCPWALPRVSRARGEQVLDAREGVVRHESGMRPLGAGHDTFGAALPEDGDRPGGDVLRVEQPLDPVPAAPDLVAEVPGVGEDGADGGGLPAVLEPVGVAVRVVRRWARADPRCSAARRSRGGPCPRHRGRRSAAPPAPSPGPLRARAA